MLIVVPPSESKRPSPEDGMPVSLDELSFPELTPVRALVLDALIETSAGPDAFARLCERPSMAGWVAANTRLRELPTRPVAQVYTGPLHGGLDLAGLSAAGVDRAGRELVFTSALWGLLRPADRIPAYRMRSWSDLVGTGRVEPMWRRVVPDLLAGAAGPDGLVVDLRPPSFQALGMPTGLGDRTVSIRIAPSAAGRRIGDVVAKRLRGQAAHHLLEAGDDPADPDALADRLGDRWPVSLEPPERRGRPWTATLVADD